MTEKNTSTLQTDFSAPSEKKTGSALESSLVRHVSFLSPFRWLQQGAADMRYTLAASLGHGLIITAMGWVVVIFTSYHLYLFAAAISGFLLVSPLMASGLYELSRRKETGQPISFERSLNGLILNGRPLARLAGLLVLLMVVWFALSSFIFSAYFHGQLPEVSGAMYQTSWLKTVGMEFLLSYSLIGGAIAAVVFAVTAISVPMIMDRGTDLTTAMGISIQVVLNNLPAMFLWAALLAGLTAIGFITQLWGMIVILPLLGHATWHAYRETVAR